MIKRLKRMLVCVLALTMLFSMTAFAAENNPSTEQETVNEINPRVQPDPVSSVTIERAYIDASTMHVIVVVFIVGYGENEIARFNGQLATMIDKQYISGAGGYVYAFREYFDCGVAVTGNYNFTFQTTSIYPPRNTVYAYEEIIVPEL